MSVTPYYQDAHVTIYHGDCREILPTLPRVALVLTDPPYGHGELWTGGTWGAASMYRDAGRWDNAVDQSDLDFAISRGDNAIVWGGNYYSLPPGSMGKPAAVGTPALDSTVALGVASAHVRCDS